MIAGISGVPRLFVHDEIPSFAKAFDDVDPEIGRRADAEERGDFRNRLGLVVAVGKNLLVVFPRRSPLTVTSGCGLSLTGPP